MLSLTENDFFDILDNPGYDGRRRNIEADCPYCGKEGKLGISIVKDGFPWQCFSCGESGRAWKLLNYLGRLDLIRNPDLDTNAVDNLLLIRKEVPELDLELAAEDLPMGYRKVADDDYLNSRGWNEEDYFYWEAGRSSHWKYRDYVILPVYMNGLISGYVSRHIWGKKKIDNHNALVKAEGEGYIILRYRNSTGNEMAKMLYGYDHIVPGITKTVIIVEGAFDVHSVNRKLDLYEIEDLKCVATFGKKISNEQVYWLQHAGIENLIILFDPDAVGTTKYKSKELDKYFNVMVGSIDDPDKDADDLSESELMDVMDNLYHPMDFETEKVVIRKLKG